MLTSERRRATAAATSIAAAVGLVVGDTIVLHDSNKLTLRLLPCDVLARVAPGEHQVAQFEIELARLLAESGCPVAALEARVEPRVYERDGFTVTLWTYYEPAGPPEPSPAGYASALERLHAGLRKLDVPAPHFTDRVEEAQRLVASRDRTPALADSDRELLGDTLRDLRRAIGDRNAAEQLLHGEPHPGNVLSTEQRATVHRLGDVLPRAGRIRPRSCAGRSQRALSGRRSRPAARLPDSRAGDDHNMALGSRRPIAERPPVGHGVAQPDPGGSRTTVRAAMLADRTSLVPNACEPTESVRIAVQRDDAQEVAARSPKDPAVEPPAELDGPQGDEPGGLGHNVVSLDVDVVAGPVVHRLDRGDQPGKRAGQRGELLLAGHRVRLHAKRRRPERGGFGRLVAGNVDKQGRSRLRCIAAP